MEDNRALETRRWDLERDEGWREMVATMPSFRFPSNWGIKMIPATGGAMLRFLVFVPKCPLNFSIYFDAFARLGYMENPYWEMYDGDETYRYDNSVGGATDLVAEIKRIVKEWKESNG